MNDGYQVVAVVDEFVYLGAVCQSTSAVSYVLMVVMCVFWLTVYLVYAVYISV